MKTAFLEPERLRAWGRVDPFRNVFFLALDLITAGVVLAAAITFIESRERWGLAWFWNVPIGAVTLILLGAVQHRIALMGHEASHNLLHPHRIWNDLLAETACFSPIFGLFSQYRSRHLSHHRYTNDPERDSNLSGDRAEKLYAKFPMDKGAFVHQYLWKFLWPPAVLAVFLDLFRVAVVDAGFSVLRSGQPNPSRSRGRRPLLRNATIYGVLYFVVLILALDSAREQGFGFLLAASPAIWLFGIVVWTWLPLSWFYDPGGRLAYSPKISGLVRLTFYTSLFVAINIAEILTGLWIGGYVALLWLVPLIYVFPYLMLLREIFQHANADTGEITNSRVIHVDPLTRWALFGYGNDVHIVHHIYPNIPHYRLAEVHREMCETSQDYRDTVEETFGVVAGGKENRSAVDSLSIERQPQIDGRESAP